MRSPRRSNPIISTIRSPRLLTLENTFNGLPLPADYIEGATELARSHGLATHLDGARVMNAAVATGADPSAIADQFDSVSLCLSKASAPLWVRCYIGSKELVGRAKRIRKTLGGGMRTDWSPRRGRTLRSTAQCRLHHEDPDRAKRLAQIFPRTSPSWGHARHARIWSSCPGQRDMDASPLSSPTRDIITGSAHGKLRWVTHWRILRRGD